jgi:hypothetical protein
MSKRKKIVLGTLVVGSAIIVGGAFTPQGKAIRTLVSTLTQKDVSGTEAYRGDVHDRLKAMHTAADLFHSSEDSYPKAEKWMDDLLIRLQTQNLKKGEAEKKLKRPEEDANSDEYGFALNREVAGKYKGDIKDPKTILIFESVETMKNAVGDPKNDGKPGGEGITISGEIVKL